MAPYQKWTAGVTFVAVKFPLLLSVVTSDKRCKNTEVCVTTRSNHQEPYWLFLLELSCVSDVLVFSPGLLGLCVALSFCVAAVTICFKNHPVFCQQYCCTALVRHRLKHTQTTGNTVVTTADKNRLCLPSVPTSASVISLASSLSPVIQSMY